MSLPVFSLPTTGTAPKATTKQVLEDNVNAALSSIYTEVGAGVSGLNPRGNWDASSGAFPSGSAKGDFWIVSVAGTVDGQAFVKGDWLVSSVVNASTAIFAANWFRGDYSQLDRREFASITAAAASTSLIDGVTYAVTSGENSEREDFTYVAASTLTADGALVVTATGMGAGRLISTRTVYADWAKFNADVRPLDIGLSLTVRGAGGFTIVASGEHFTTAGGLKVVIADDQAKPQHYGTPNAAAFTALFANHLNITIPFQVAEYFCGALSIRDGHNITFQAGAKVKQATSGERLFSAIGVSNFRINRPEFVGTLTEAPTSALFLGATHEGEPLSLGWGLYLQNCARYVVNSPKATKFAGHGIYTAGGTLNGTLRGDKGQIIAASAHECAIGLRADAGSGGEYVNWSIPDSSGNFVGFRMSAGNHTVSGGNIVDNNVNVFLSAGGVVDNHLHGIFSAVNINHATVYNIHAKGVINGHSFEGCHLYGNGGALGAIFFENSKGIVLDGGHLDCFAYNYEGPNSGKNYIKNMYCPGSYGIVQRYDSLDLTPYNLIITDCYGPGAIIEEGVNSFDINNGQLRIHFLGAASKRGGSPGVTVERTPSGVAVGDYVIRLPRRVANFPTLSVSVEHLSRTPGNYFITQYNGTAIEATTDATGYAIGDTGAPTITLAAAGSGAILAGDKISFAGDDKVYSVTTGDADVSGGGSIVLSTDLAKAIPASATAITVHNAYRLETYTQNGGTQTQADPVNAQIVVFGDL
ncbi:MAG TPA: hypothetical protein ENH56_05665 [Roseobacter sp.]|uniref:Ubiquitin-activating enzyme E1 FCCH domain-containing protein n=1 Tax=marine sediment metagenome TaxID=412755 RepID=A0A0F9T4D0_9ZZZZ|nr:hypothetical protein [Roseobacter sp.]